MLVQVCDRDCAVRGTGQEALAADSGHGRHGIEREHAQVQVGPETAACLSRGQARDRRLLQRYVRGAAGQQQVRADRTTAQVRQIEAPPGRQAQNRPRRVQLRQLIN